MDPRLKTFLMWCGVVGLCFIGIPFHLKGRDRELLELQYKNYSESFNKTVDESQYEERLQHFEKSLRQIKKLQTQQKESILRTKPSDLLTSTSDWNGEGKEEFVSRNMWHPGMPKNQGYAAWGLTSMSDMSPDEFQRQYLDLGMSERIKKRQRHAKYSGDSTYFDADNDVSANVVRKRRATSNLPDKVDWRNRNVVAAVRHQKNCGACWAFSTIETVESMYAIQKNKLEPLSVQQVIDCATNGNMGCNGGDTCSALEWMSGRRLMTEAEYPLTLKDGNCLLMAPARGVQINKNYTCSNFDGDENSLLSVLANHGPVAAAVDATNWQFYVGGVIQWNCDSNNNHAIQIVGYDKTKVPHHYIVRNSWGTKFGDNGYLYVAIGSNLCGIAREVSSVSVM